MSDPRVVVASHGHALVYEPTLRRHETISHQQSRENFAASVRAIDRKAVVAWCDAPQRCECCEADPNFRH